MEKELFVYIKLLTLRSVSARIFLNTRQSNDLQVQCRRLQRSKLVILGIIRVFIFSRENFRTYRASNKNILT